MGYEERDVEIKISSTLDEVLVDYFAAHSPVDASIEGRIVHSTETEQQLPGKGGDNGNGAVGRLEVSSSRVGLLIGVVMSLAGMLTSV